MLETGKSHLPFPHLLLICKCCAISYMCPAHFDKLQIVLCEDKGLTALRLSQEAMEVWTETEIQWMLQVVCSRKDAPSMVPEGQQCPHLELAWFDHQRG